MKLLHVVGARPNFPKLAPVYRAAEQGGLEQCVVHTGQHYDDALSASFFRDLSIRPPDVNLEVGSSSHAVQVARIMERFEPVLEQYQPDWVAVYGDVNSTVAAALVASKLGVRVAHVEAGLRSNDRRMPEEINRIVTDRLADLLLAPSRDAVETLRGEGEPDHEIAFVGNVMIDSLFFALPEARRIGFRESLGLERDSAVIVTLHRPSNVDDPHQLGPLLRTIEQSAGDMPLVFPVHPRTRARLQQSQLTLDDKRWRLTEPLGYLDFLKLTAQARIVLTDSGGVQEETTVLGVPCVTLRENTERPVTISEGTNFLAGTQPASVAEHVAKALAAPTAGRVPRFWDGRSAERIVEILERVADVP